MYVCLLSHHKLLMSFDTTLNITIVVDRVIENVYKPFLSIMLYSINRYRTVGNKLWHAIFKKSMARETR